MRPLELTLEGFRSYRAITTFDFDGRGLFGIVGPTGAGKSSILDGLIYALYGRTPRIGKDTKKLIASGEAVARVRLLFEVDGTAWEVTRVLREQGASHVDLKRQGDGALEASRAGDVNDRICEIIGLDYEAFCSSVMLPQGEFDRFLKATPSDRSKILKRIFRYERVDAMREGAKHRLNDIDVDLKAEKAALSALPADPEAVLAELESQRSVSEARVTSLQEAAAGFAPAQAQVAAAEASLSDVRTRVALFEATLVQIPPASSLETLAAEEEGWLGRLSAAEHLHAQARLEEGSLVALAAGIEAEFGGERLATARALAGRRDQVGAGASRRRASFTERTQELTEARSALSEQEVVAAAADDRCRKAEEALAAARQAHAAHLLRGALRPGEPCPVCSQQVVQVPPGAPVAPVDAALGDVERTARTAKVAAARLTALHREVSSAEARLHAAEQEMELASRELGELEATLADIVGDGVDVAAEIFRRDALLAESRTNAAAARQKVDWAAEGVKAALAGLEDRAKKRRHVAGELIRISTVIGVDPPGIEDDALALAGVAKRARDAGAAGITEQNQLGAQIVAGEVQSRNLLSALRAQLGLGPQERLEDALQAVAKVLGALGQKIADAEKAIELRAAHEARIAELQTRRGLYQRLASDLTDARFIAYLLDTERQRLARLASEKLLQITGRYRFDEAGQFNVLDVANGVVRSPDTLSGGETFLASLALALALADTVSEGGSRLDCFFLDEGFGSLDAASLDLALEGVAGLALPGRLIGVISHVGGVQAWLDDLIALEKAPDGSTIVLQMEGPIAYPAGTI